MDYKYLSLNINLSLNVSVVNEIDNYLINSKDIFCIYHSEDLDGWCSAAIIKYKYPNVKLIPYNYGEPIPEILNSSESILFVCDVSFPMHVFKDISEKHDIIWIDHHISAMKDFHSNESNKEIFKDVFLDDSFAACENVWKYLYGRTLSPFTTPEFVTYLGKYDSFRHKGTEEYDSVMFFQYGARALISNPDECLRYLKLTIFDKGTINSFLDKGSVIYNFLCKDAQNEYKTGFILELDGFNFISFNKKRFNPISYKIDYHKDGYDGVLTFWFDSKQKRWLISLYNDNGNVDVSVICKKYGGGGHKGAAGFSLNNDDLNKLLNL